MFSITGGWLLQITDVEFDHFLKGEHASDLGQPTTPIVIEQAP
jgi:hypothetical protein